MLSYSINKLSVNDCFLELAKQFLLRGELENDFVCINNIVATCDVKQKYLPSSYFNVLEVSESLFKTLSDENVTNSLYKLAEENLKNGEFLITPSHNFSISCRKNFISGCVTLSSINILEFGNIIFYYSSILEIISSLLNLYLGNITIFFHKGFLNKSLKNVLYDNLTSQKTVYFNPTPIKVSSLTDVKNIYINYINHNFFENEGSLRNLILLKMVNDLILSNEIQEAKRIAVNIDSLSFEKFYLKSSYPNVI